VLDYHQYSARVPSEFGFIAGENTVEEVGYQVSRGTVTAHGHSTRSQHTVTAHGHSTRSQQKENAVRVLDQPQTAHSHNTQTQPRSQHTITAHGHSTRSPQKYNAVRVLDQPRPKTAHGHSTRTQPRSQHTDTATVTAHGRSNRAPARHRRSCRSIRCRTRPSTPVTSTPDTASAKHATQITNKRAND